MNEPSAEPPGSTPPWEQPPVASAPSPYAAAPRPMTPADERTWAMLSHVVPAVCSVLSAGTVGFVGSLIIYLLYKDRGPFVRAAAASSLNIQLTAVVVMLVSLPLMLVLIGFVTFAVAAIAALVLNIIGAVRANEGQWWTPPLTIRFVS
ncbi:MAG: DUF4870 domain-containing protein [Nostocoides sp.]